MIIPLAICIGAPGIAACLLTYCGLARKQELRMLALMRQSTLSTRLYAKMDALKHHDIDELRIEPNGVTVTSASLAITLLNFDFKRNGNFKRNDAAVRLVAQLLEHDFPLFADRGAYQLRRYRVYRVNGKVEMGVCYAMRRTFRYAARPTRGAVELRVP
ncbi:MAG: hypothetical protein GX810_09460 [Clostridiales bacterium]|nr:hypothetical protein [Clostridiales bacterium]